jgi:2-C-methyl-D-erythritol 2,4-cyclodiphosphate synthase
VIRLVREEGYELGNIDATIALQVPKVKPHIEEMKECIAAVMNVKVNQVSIKATTTEKLGFVGRQEGIEAYAVVLIENVQDN